MKRKIKKIITALLVSAMVFSLFVAGSAAGPFEIDIIGTSGTPLIGASLIGKTHTFPAQTAGYSTVTSLAVTVANTGTSPTGDLTVTISTATPSSFVMATGTSLASSTSLATSSSLATITSIASGAGSTLVIWPNAGLPAGTYTAIIRISNAAGTIDEYFTVYFTVNPTGTTLPTGPGGGSGGGGGVSLTYYTVKFNSNGGSAVPDQTVASGGNVIRPPNPTRAGYEFAGWYSDAALSAVYDFDQKVSNGFTLYAKWTAVTSGTTETPANPFEDVRESDWFYEDILYVYLKGLMLGTSESPMLFSPHMTVTRGMVVTVLYRMENEPGPGEAGNPFSDVADGMYYTDAVIWAALNGIVYGYGDGRFGAQDFITREQLATILYRYSIYKGFDVSVGENTNILSYNDAFDISEYAIPAIQWACGAGVMYGRPGGYLDPRGNATRAEIAAMLHRFLTQNN